jgi:hypothetical protein
MKPSLRFDVKGEKQINEGSLFLLVFAIHYSLTTIHYLIIVLYISPCIRRQEVSLRAF